MSLSFIYWFLLLCWIVFGSWRGFGPNADRTFFGGSVILFILFFVLGLKLFGFPING